MCYKDNCLVCKHNQSDICRSIRQMKRTPVATAPTPYRLSENAMLFEVGDKPGLVGVLKRGYLRRERLTREGDRTVIGLDLPGDLVGELPGRTVKYTLEAATDCEICHFEPSAVERFIDEDAVFRRGVVAAMDEQLLRQLNMALIRGALSSRERILAFLLWASTMIPCEPLPDGSVVISVPVGRKDWADLCNTSMETISRLMTELSVAGIVTHLEGKRYRVQDPARLVEMAGLDDPFFTDTHPRHPTLLTAINAVSRKNGTSEAERPKYGARPGRTKPPEVDHGTGKTQG
ncbi:Crp/Fnr family transcriptional regulator [Marimonas lutisalis]|uniref:Crp/Fnr family transcriptional regulator n=1 Tax=Marimonas lutisalis TaxID=2545756 RepID=UPI0010F8BE28|nr:Crp/Fnr family transcriptional regulator [Marimonas lutisalis]